MKFINWERKGNFKKEFTDKTFGQTGRQDRMIPI